MVAATDIFALVLRIFIVILVLVMFIELVYSFSVVVNTDEPEKVMVELSENMMSSNFKLNPDSKELTISRAIFDRDALIKLNKNTIEPVRNCKFGALYEFSDLETGEKISSFGFTADIPLTKLRKDFLVAMAKDNKIVPAKMHIAIFDDRLGKVTCSMEKAWIDNEVQELELDVYFSIRREDDAIRFSTAKRWLPTEIALQPNDFSMPEGFVEETRKNGKSPVILFIPMKVSDFNSQGCIDWRNPDNTNFKPSENDQRIICMKESKK